jgi:DNA-binding NtrC family response regulator
MTLARTNPPVLLVEDDPSVLRVLEHMLSKFHLDIECASSFFEAKAYIDRYSISALITDETLGDGSGMALAAYALGLYPEIRVGVISGDITETPEELQGRVEFLAKPFSTDELRVFVDGFPRKSKPA